MNETTQTQINLGDYNKPQKQTKAVGIGKILGKNINIKDFKTNRGKPSPYTPKDAIGEDGMTDYNVIDTVETFDVNSQQVGSFFVTPSIVKQIQSPKPSIRIRCMEGIWTMQGRSEKICKEQCKLLMSSFPRRRRLLVF